MAKDDVIDLGEVRRRAWETRRKKYGPAGHRGISITYLRHSSTVLPEHIQQARDAISQARRSCQLMLPDEQAHWAIDRLDEAEHLLGGGPIVRAR